MPPADVVASADDPVDTAADLSGLSKSELRERASAAGLTFKSKMGKQQLRDLLANAS